MLKRKKFKRLKSPEYNKEIKRQLLRYGKVKKGIVVPDKIIIPSVSVPKFTDNDVFLLKRTLAEKCLLEFIKQSWHILEPNNPFADGWHLHAICDHLEAVATGQIKRLLLNIPPRHMKSLAVSVFFPCWLWTKYPEKRSLFSSYSSDLSQRDGRKSLVLLNSDWYRKNWGDKFVLDKETDFKIENSKRGYRIATSVGGMTTGEGGDLIVTDDPHSAKEIESDIKRIAVLRWWDEVMSTRLNDQKTGVKIIIMQRLHEKDLSGHVLAKGDDYVHLCLPARYEINGDRTRTIIPFKDPRTKENEVLWEAKFADKELSILERELGEYARAGQLQQRPSPRGGGLFKVANFIKKTSVDFNEIKRAVRYWDKAGTEGGGCYTCGVLMFSMRNGSFFIYDIVSGQWNASDREKHIDRVVKADTYHSKRNKYSYQCWVEQEPGSAGKESALATIRRLAGYRVYADRVTGSKESRATDFAVQVEIGNVCVLDTSWTNLYFERMEFYPMGEFKDWGDASSGSFNKLIRAKLAGSWGNKERVKK